MSQKSVAAAEDVSVAFVLDGQELPVKGGCMKTLALIFGVLLTIATFIWFFYLVPLGCAMNTTGCHQQFEALSTFGLRNFWAPLAIAFAAIVYGIKRS